MDSQPPTRPIRRFEGACHCGAVRFAIETDFPEVTTCDCSICKRKNALMVKVHESRFELIAGGEALAEYRFHTHTARHFFCRTCGIYPFHRKRSDPSSYGVNTGCLEAFDPTSFPVRRADGASMTIETEQPRAEWRGPYGKRGA